MVSLGSAALVWQFFDNSNLFISTQKQAPLELHWICSQVSVYRIMA